MLAESGGTALSLQEALGKDSSAEPVPLSPRAYNQVITLGQAVKGRDSISLPVVQLDPAGTQADPGTRRVGWPGAVLGQRICSGS